MQSRPFVTGKVPRVCETETLAGVPAVIVAVPRAQPAPAATLIAIWTDPFTGEFPRRGEKERSGRSGEPRGGVRVDK
jgi:hypothetical protein